MTNNPMLMNPEYLKFCKYYKGESENPLDGINGFFWMCEKLYCSTTDHTEWEERANKYIKTHNGVKNRLTSKDIPIEEKGFILFAEAMLQKWCPENVDMIFEYGKDD